MKNRRLLCAAVTAFFIFTGISGIAAEKAARMILGKEADPDDAE